MPSSKKGEQMNFGMRTYIFVDSEYGLVKAARVTSDNLDDVAEGTSLLHREDVMGSEDEN